MSLFASHIGFSISSFNCNSHFACGIGHLSNSTKSRLCFQVLFPWILPWTNADLVLAFMLIEWADASNPGNSVSLVTFNNESSSNMRAILHDGTRITQVTFETPRRVWRNFSLPVFYSIIPVKDSPQE